MSLFGCPLPWIPGAVGPFAPPLHSPGLAVGLGFFQLHVHSVISCLRSLPTDVYFENCIIKPCQVGHLPF